ncbi:putative Sporulation kinase A [Candidatus Sulfobium mesophilum]|uniref:histidine kinase n=1 Tax=Candidatus Sulfobium mesophilum TaxID=2016548 RepID=A0A2U3QED5_9BACT|nr:putative Sporulation kinase A [Candidatus Sulfobium mesophilum]
MSGENPTILCVDDEPPVLRLLEDALKPKQFDIVKAETAEQALEKFDSSRIDIVLTDIIMPVVSGIDLLEKIHALSPDTPVILMTGFADMEKAIEAVKKEAFDFLIKPFKLDQLIGSLEKALQFSRLARMEADYKRILEDFNQQIETLVAERTMSLMALTVADRIRNPAYVTRTVCKRLADREEMSVKVREGLELIGQQAEKLGKIVDEFQAFLKNTRSLFVYEDLNALVADVSSLIHKECIRKGVQLQTDLCKTSARINMHKNLMHVAIFHILQNAVEATPRDGWISVSSSVGPDTVLLKISDSGIGIAPEDIPRVFDPFFSTKRSRFGMGLSLVKQIVSEHLGRISLDSEPNNGTTFTLEFPVSWFGKFGV